jgi:DNA-binding response OmpR family regulator
MGPAGFSLGASDYLLKIDAGRELLAAVDAVLRGEQCVRRRFAAALKAALWISTQNVYSV